MRIPVALILLSVVSAHAEDDLIERLSLLPVVDEVVLGLPDPGHRFIELPGGSSRIATHAGIVCRELPHPGEAKAFAVRIGEGKGLVARHAYVLEVDFAEDAPRTFFVLNRGDQSKRGIACGTSIPDSINKHTGSNPESVDIPLSGGIRTWRSLFWLQDRFTDILDPAKGEAPPMVPADGFWVIICQAEGARHPGSDGAAVSAIRLRAVGDPAAFDLALRRPPADLPQRRVTWREESGDAVVSPHRPEQRHIEDVLSWYGDKIRLMRFLGIDTFGRDLLEFGHNQGWDSAPYGGGAWVNQTAYPERWAAIVDLMGQHEVPIMPYYEYAGSIGAGDLSLGRKKRAQTLGGQEFYTHIHWIEKANIDITDPEAVEDFARILDCTVFAYKDRARFLGAWLRPRPGFMPIGFGDDTRARFATDANAGQAVTREQLAADTELRARYYDWWFDKRRDFLVAVRDRMVAAGIQDPLVLFTSQGSEPAPSLPGEPLVVVGDVEPWGDRFAGDDRPRPVVPLTEILAADAYLKAILAFATNWGGHEWHHAAPPADPRRYVDVPGVLMTYPFNRVYTTASSTAFDAFRGISGLAAVRFQPLNEHSLDKGHVGTFLADVEYSGPASMLGEVLAVANGDPTILATLTAGTLARGFPEYVRPFHAAFLALPALPSERIAATSVPDVVVRRIDGGDHGMWLAVCNTGFAARPGTTIQLPAGVTAVVDAATGQALAVVDGLVTVDLPPVSLRALHGTH